MSRYEIQENGKDKVYLFDTDEALEKWQCCNFVVEPKVGLDDR